MLGRDIADVIMKDLSLRSVDFVKVQLAGEYFGGKFSL